MPAALLLIPGLFGLLAGSFLNACIYRLPRGISIVHPGSHCPRCGAPVRAWQKVPVLSYVLLRGRCGACRAPISPRYPLVELATAALFVWVAHEIVWPPLATAAPLTLSAATLLPLLSFCKWAFLLTSLLALALIDLDLRLLPDEITLGGFAVGLLLTIWVPPPGSAAGLPGWEAALGGALIGGGVLWGAGALYWLLRGREGMGQGDVKMMAFAGLFLGIKLTLLSLVLACLAASLLGILVMASLLARRWRRWRKRGLPPAPAWQRAKSSTQAYFSRLPLPFGLFLGTMAIISWGCGESLWSWYLRAMMGR